MEISDEELMAQVKLGNTVAYEKLVKKYKDRIINFIFRMVGNREIAEDITQETFLRLFTKAATFRVGATFSTWLYRIATNLSINELRRKKRVFFFHFDNIKNDDDKDSKKIDLPDTRIRADEKIIKDEFKQEMEKAIKKLPLKYKTVFLLRDIQGLAYEEIAMILGVPLGTIKSRVNRARLKFKNIMQPYLET